MTQLIMNFEQVSKGRVFINVLDLTIVGIVSVTVDTVTYLINNGRWACTVSLAEFNRLHEVY